VTLPSQMILSVSLMISPCCLLSALGGSTGEANCGHPVLRPAPTDSGYSLEKRGFATLVLLAATQRYYQACFGAKADIGRQQERGDQALIGGERH